MRLLSWWQAGLIASCVLPCWGVGCNRTAPPPQPDIRQDDEKVRAEPRAEQEAKLNGPALTVSARELWAAYHTDAASAEKKYKGKWLEITGKVIRVDAFFTTWFLHLEGGTKPDEIVECGFLPDTHEQSKNIKEGDIITIRGMCDKRWNDRVLVTGCLLRNRTK